MQGFQAKVYGFKRVDFIICGDQNSGKFRMTFKNAFVFISNATISILHHIGSVEFIEDDMKILKKSVFETVGEGLKEIVVG